MSFIRMKEIIVRLMSGDRVCTSHPDVWAANSPAGWTVRTPNAMMVTNDVYNAARQLLVSEREFNKMGDLGPR